MGGGDGVRLRPGALLLRGAGVAGLAGIRGVGLLAGGLRVGVTRLWLLARVGRLI